MDRAERGAGFWVKVRSEQNSRGVADCLSAVADGLKGFQQAIACAFPKTRAWTCIVHPKRHGLSLCGHKECREMALDRKAAYGAESVEVAEDRREEFVERWAKRYSSVAASWSSNWEEIVPMFAFPPEIRRLPYATNAIESLNRSLRNIIKSRGHFPHDRVATKLPHLALRNIERKRKAPFAG